MRKIEYKMLPILLIVAGAFSCVAFAVFAGWYIRYHTNNILAQKVFSDEILYIQLKKPFPLLGFAADYKKYFDIIDIDELMGWNADFFHDLFPSVRSEAAIVFVKEPDLQPIVLLETKDHAKLKKLLPEFTITSVNRDIAAVSRVGIPVERYVRHSMKRNIVSLAHSSFIRFAPVKAHSSILGQNDISVLLKKHEGVWNFSMYPANEGLPPYEESMPRGFRRVVLENSADDVFGAGLPLKALALYGRNIFNNEKAFEYFYEKLMPKLSATADFAYSADISGEYRYVVSIKADRVEEDELISGLKTVLSYVFPLTQEKLLPDGTPVFEERANPEHITVIYTDAYNKILYPEYLPAKQWHFNFQDGVVTVSNNFAFLHSHLKKSPPPSVAEKKDGVQGHCGAQQMGRYFFFGNGFDNVLIKTFSQTQEYVDMLKRVVSIRGVYASAAGKVIYGCIVPNL